MIELYLAILLFGLGTYFNQKDSYQKTNAGKIEPRENVDLDVLEAQGIPTKPSPQIVQEMEDKYGDQLDSKCNEIQPRDFAHLMDPSSKQMYENIKLGEQGQKYGLNGSTPESKDTVYSSLTGKNMNLNDFTNSQTIAKTAEGKTNFNSSPWAVPYFGSVAKQNMSVEGFQNKLERFTGNSQFNFHKKETKSFFVPGKNIGFVNGSPVNTDFMQTRFNKSRFKTGELPFKKVRVAPGVGQNYGSKGSGNFHQFEVGEIARPKNVDELRSLSNPKITYKQPVISGKRIDKRSSRPNLYKNRVSKTFPQTQANLLKTTGAYRKETSRPNIVVKDTNRTNSKAVFGSAAPVNNKRTYTVPKFKKPFRNIYGSYGLTNAHVKNAWAANSKNSDYGRGSFKAVPNERDVTQKRTHLSNVMSMIKSIIAPIQDKIKSSRKEFVIGNPNPEGYMGADMPKKQTVYDPNDIAKTTIKETTLEYDHDGNIKGPNKLSVHDPNDVAKTTIKETTLEYDHDGNIKGPEKTTVYDPNDIARTTIKETTIHNKMHTVVTGAQKVSVYDPNDVARTTTKETTIHNKHNGNLRQQVPSRPTNNDIQAPKTTLKETTIDNKHIANVSYVRGDGKGYLSNDFFAPATLKQLTSDNEYEGNIYSSIFSSGGYLSNEYYAPSTLKQITSDKEYVGSANSSHKASRSYGSAYNAITNSLREKVLRGRAPTQNGAKQFNGGKESMNISYKKQGINITRDKQLKIGRITQRMRDSRSERMTNTKSALSNRAHTERYNPAQLNMLKRNPYALSISRRFGGNRGTSGFSSGSDSE